MTFFDDRERAYEAKFAHDAEKRFKVEARARNLLALWAAHAMGREGDAAVDYAKEVLTAWMQPHAGDAVERILADLAAAGAKVTEAETRARFAELRRQAMAQVMDEL